VQLEPKVKANEPSIELNVPDVEPNKADPPSNSPAKFKPVIKWIETPDDAIFVIRWMCRAPFKTSLVLNCTLT